MLALLDLSDAGFGRGGEAGDISGDIGGGGSNGDGSENQAGGDENGPKEKQHRQRQHPHLHRRRKAQAAEMAAVVDEKITIPEKLRRRVRRLGHGA